MAISPRQTAAARQKEELEIAKLAIDIRHSNRTFIAQIFNTIAIVILGIAGLYLFQRPQLEQMKATQLSNERIQLGNAVVAIQKFENDNDRLTTIEVLAKQWPEQTWLEDLAQSYRITAANKNADKQKCSDIDQQIANSQSSLHSLEESLLVQMTPIETMTLLGRKLVTPSPNPVALSLQIQIRTLEDNVAVLLVLRSARNCPP